MLTLKLRYAITLYFHSYQRRNNVQPTATTSVRPVKIWSINDFSSQMDSLITVIKVGKYHVWSWFFCDFLLNFGPYKARAPYYYLSYSKLNLVAAESVPGAPTWPVRSVNNLRKIHFSWSFNEVGKTECARERASPNGFFRPYGFLTQFRCEALPNGFLTFLQLESCWVFETVSLRARHFGFLTSFHQMRAFCLFEVFCSFNPRLTKGVVATPLTVFLR